jgi:hypothetical protein
MSHPARCRARRPERCACWRSSLRLAALSAPEWPVTNARVVRGGTGHGLWGSTTGSGLARAVSWAEIIASDLLGRLPVLLRWLIAAGGRLVR